MSSLPTSRHRYEPSWQLPSREWSLRLLRKSDGTGRVAAFEIMLITHAIKNLIQTAKTHQIYSAMQTGREQGMLTMTRSLKKLCRESVITREEAMKIVDDPKTFEDMRD